jgi:hypothetical protein
MLYRQASLPKRSYMGDTLMFTTSYWEPGVLAFIGTWYKQHSKADILAHLKTVRAQWVCATLIRDQGNRATLKAAGFKPVAYGGRNGTSGSIHLWMMKNPFYPKRVDGPDHQASAFYTYSCGVYNEYMTCIPPKNRIYVSHNKLRSSRELCPGWYVVGKKGHSFMYV